MLKTSKNPCFFHVFLQNFTNRNCFSDRKFQGVSERFRESFREFQGVSGESLDRDDPKSMFFMFSGKSGFNVLFFEMSEKIGKKTGWEN